MNEEKAPALKESSARRTASPFGDMERLFDRLLARRGWLRPWHPDWPAAMELDWPEVRVPRVDILDREDDLQLKMEVPGMDKKNIDISVGQDSVTVKGDVERENKEEAGDYVCCEIARGAFSRTIALPAAVDGTRAKAQFKDGLLTLTLPKVERARRHAVQIE